MSRRITKAIRTLRLPRKTYPLFLLLLLLPFLFLTRTPLLPRTSPPPQPLSFVFFRAIGNDLPPRHEAGQTYRNLEFILTNEPILHNVQKRWLLNRLVDQELQAKIITLLKAHNQSFIVDPVDFTTYSNIPLTQDCSHGDMLHTNRSRDHNARSATLERLNTQRNLYVMHNNQARNIMLREGMQSNADYILPWDGNCYLSHNAWRDIQDGIENVRVEIANGNKNVSDKYFAVPMARLTDNAVLLQPEFQPKAKEEHQLIFHRSAKESFNPRRRYGVMPKVDLLLRLGVHGPWDRWLPHRPKLSPDVPCQFCVRSIAWVARLFSGKARLEIGPHSLSRRGFSRLEGVIKLLNKVDAVSAETVYGFSNTTMLFFDERSLKESRILFQSKEAGTTEIVQKLIKAADAEIRNGAVYSVVLSERPGTDPHDFLQHHRQLLRNFAHNTSVLALAGYMTRDARYTTRAAKLVTVWCVDEATRMNAHIRQASSLISGQPSAAAFGNFIDFIYVLDAIRLLDESGAFRASDRESITTWVTNLSIYIGRSSHGRRGFAAGGLDGVRHDILLAACYGFLGQTEGYVNIVRQSGSRLFGGFCGGNGTDVDGMFEWGVLARMANRAGVRLQDVKGGKGELLRIGFERLGIEGDEVLGGIERAVWEIFRALYPEIGGRNLAMEEVGEDIDTKVPPFWDLAL